MELPTLLKVFGFPLPLFCTAGSIPLAALVNIDRQYSLLLDQGNLEKILSSILEIVTNFIQLIRSRHQ